MRRSEEEIHVHLNGLQHKDPHLLDMGWNSFFANHFLELDDPRLVPARVVEESRGIYRVRRAREEYAAKIAGKIRYLAQARKDFPAVGDWVAIAPHDESQSRIECILPRKTKLSRKVAGRELNEQIVAANVDNVFVVSSLNREFNLRRIERYLTLVWDSGAAPVVLLNKTDLCADAAAQASAVGSIALDGAYAFFFGVGPAMEAFFGAIALFNSSSKLLHGSALQDVFMPIFMQTRKTSSAQDSSL